MSKKEGCRKRKRLTGAGKVFLSLLVLLWAFGVIRLACPAVTVSAENLETSIPATILDAAACGAPTDIGSLRRYDPTLPLTRVEAKSPAYNYSLPVPASDAVADSYFDDAVFIGDSRTDGFALYAGLTQVRSYAYQSMTVERVYTEPVLYRGGVKVTIMDALKGDAGFAKAYVMLGMNEMGWTDLDYFIQKYSQIIDSIRALQPEVRIYVQSILPVTQSKSDSDSVFNNPRVQSFNSLIQTMCEEKQVYYLDVYSGLADANGALPADSSFDGVHLYSAYCQKWLEYLKTHTVTEGEE